MTVFPAGAADVVIALLGLAGLGLSLWLVGVRDWRVYGVFCLWPEVAGEMRVAHLTPVLAVAAAVAWRTRRTSGAPGLAIGFATSVKFLMWPLVVWLAATRRTRDALVAGAVVCGSLLLVLPYTGLDALHPVAAPSGPGVRPGQLHRVRDARRRPARRSRLPAPRCWLSGVRCWSRPGAIRSFTLAIATALALSPIVWLDYFALAAVPLAIHRPRLSWVWFAPLGTWGLRGAGLGIGEFWHTARLLVVFAIVLGVALAAEHDAAAKDPAAHEGDPLGPGLARRFGRSSTA